MTQETPSDATGTGYKIDHDVELLIVGTWSDTLPTPAQKAALRAAYHKTIAGIEAAEALIERQSAELAARMRDFIGGSCRMEPPLD